jgi:TM2 domain-containing membrane protein YozV
MRLASVFSTPAPKATASPPANISAAPGASVIHITNQIGTPINALLLDDGVGPKSPGIALLLSFVFVGAGQLYNGQIAKGILMFLGCVVLWFALLGWIINIWSWIDAYSTAKAMNQRYLRRLAAGVVT